MKLNNKVQLITYPDSLGKDLKELKFVLDTYLKEIIYGVHILPFYPSSCDRGFGVKTHLEVDKDFGDWNDIKNISKNHDLMVDLIANHISDESKYFQDYLQKGEDSKYADMFLTMDKLSPTGIIDENEFKKIYRPRPGMPYIEKEFANKNKKKLWYTFTTNQIDLDWNSAVTRNLMNKFILKLTSSGAKIIRLDAMAYIIKKMGTNCFFLPEVHQIMNEIKELTKDQDVKLLPEVHFHYSLQLELAKKYDYVYDFALPLLILHTLFTGSTKRLKHWIKIRPNNQITTLDTHDGIGAIDVEGLMSQNEINNMINEIYKNGGNATFRATGENSNNVDVYQINCTYYSALKEDDKKYLIARAIQLFTPGIPQIYYVGLLAGTNDIKRLEETNNGREIMRHNYTIKEIEQNLERPVVQELFKLIRFRNTHLAFNGQFTMHKTTDNILKMSWQKENHKCTLTVNMKNYTYKIDDLQQQLIPTLTNNN